MPSEDVLAAQIVALQELMETGFKHINKRLDDLCSRTVSTERFEAWCRRIDKLETGQDRHDTRLEKLERVNYLLGIIGTLAMVVLGALAVAIASGKLQMVWK